MNIKFAFNKMLRTLMFIALSASALIALALPRSISAQSITTTMAGEVQCTSGSPLAGVQVTVGGIAVTTSTNGLYSISGLQIGGSYSAWFIKSGYQTVTIAGNVIVTGTNTVNVTMAQTTTAPPTMPISNHRIVAYITGGDPFGVYKCIDYAKITDLIYDEVFVTSASNAALVDGGDGIPFAMLTKIRTTAKAVNPNIKYMVCLSGGNYNSHDAGNLTQIMSNSTLRKQLVNNLVSLVSTYSLDGIDIDWEGTDVVPTNYAAFLSALKTALPSGKIISVTGAGAETYHVWYTPATINADVNFVNIMMYNISTLPVYAAYYDIVTYLNQWLSNGFTPGQLNLGIALVGTDNTQQLCSYGQIISQLNPNISLNQESVSTINGLAGNNLKVSGGVLWWNGVDLAISQANLVESDALGGIMLWPIDYDAVGNPNSLLTNIANVLEP